MRSFIGLIFVALLTVAIGCVTADPPDQSRCNPAPPELAAQIARGLTAGGSSCIERVYTVKNNDGRPWSFIGGAIYAPGMDGEVAVWATQSLDLDNQPILLAADTMAAEFSAWDFPSGGKDRFGDQFNDEIKAAKWCASTDANG
ncbi:MAG: hypothetical protein J4F46_07225 [Dehalococcoidia bacterium]|nr:hypothetical protein [Dehalococcoidia bacterium]